MGSGLAEAHRPHAGHWPWAVGSQGTPLRVSPCVARTRSCVSHSLCPAPRQREGQAAPRPGLSRVPQAWPPGWLPAARWTSRTAWTAGAEGSPAASLSRPGRLPVYSSAGFQRGPSSSHFQPQTKNKGARRQQEGPPSAPGEWEALHTLPVHGSACLSAQARWLLPPLGWRRPHSSPLSPCSVSGHGIQGPWAAHCPGLLRSHLPAPAEQGEVAAASALGPCLPGGQGRPHLLTPRVLVPNCPPSSLPPLWCLGPVGRRQL